MAASASYGSLNSLREESESPFVPMATWTNQPRNEVVAVIRTGCGSRVRKVIVRNLAPVSLIALAIISEVVNQHLYQEGRIPLTGRFIWSLGSFFGGGVGVQGLTVNLSRKHRNLLNSFIARRMLEYGVQIPAQITRILSDAQWEIARPIFYAYWAILMGRNNLSDLVTIGSIQAQDKSPYPQDDVTQHPFFGIPDVNIKHFAIFHISAAVLVVAGAILWSQLPGLQNTFNIHLFEDLLEIGGGFIAGQVMMRIAIAYSTRHEAKPLRIAYNILQAFGASIAGATLAIDVRGMKVLTGWVLGADMNYSQIQYRMHTYTTWDQEWTAQNSNRATRVMRITDVVFAALFYVALFAFQGYNMFQVPWFSQVALGILFGSILTSGGLALLIKRLRRNNLNNRLVNMLFYILIHNPKMLIVPFLYLFYGKVDVSGSGMQRYYEERNYTQLALAWIGFGFWGLSLAVTTLGNFSPWQRLYGMTPPVAAAIISNTVTAPIFGSTVVETLKVAGRAVSHVVKAVSTPLINTISSVVRSIFG